MWTRFLSASLLTVAAFFTLTACGGGGGGGNNPPSAAPIQVFSADGDGGRELWRTDGTEAGTVRVKDIHPGPLGSFPSGFTFLNGAWYFAADDGESGMELWKTDGTEAGTVRVKDINTTAPGAGSVPGDFKVFTGELYFSADDGESGRELWKTDGTGEHTAIVKDINATAPGAGSFSSGFTVFNTSDVLAGSELYFSADDGVNGFELWKTDGTGFNTVMVKDINSTAPGAGSNPSGFTVFRTGSGPLAKNELFFSADDGVTGMELWKSDGTEPGTVRVMDICPLLCSGGSSNPGGFTVFKGELFFAASLGVNGRLLYKTDGTTANTDPLLNLDFSGGGSGGGPTGFTIFNSELYFRGDDSDGIYGNELWKTDGTADGTVIVKNINATASGAHSTPVELTVYNGALYFRADDGVSGIELWKSDGSEPGTVRVKDINATSPGAGSRPFGFADLTPGGAFAGGTTMYFSADDGVSGFELWKTDGTEAGTAMVKDICPDVCSGLAD
jgi:ELWxxDGT repeat protein